MLLSIQDSTIGDAASVLKKEARVEKKAGNSKAVDTIIIIIMFDFNL